MLRDSLFEDLREYLGLTEQELRSTLDKSHQAVIEHWNNSAPQTREEREHFYEDTGTYLPELAAWIIDFPDRQSFNDQVTDFAKHLKLRTALDFGAGIANEGLQLAQDGLDVHLCEVSPISRNFAMWRAQKHLLAHRIKVVDELIVSKTRYDLGVLIDVIGHVEEPIELAIELARHCQYLYYTPDFQIPGGQWPMHAEKPQNFDRVMNGVWKNLHGNFWESRIYRPKFSLSPSLKEFGSGEGGVKRQIEALYKLLPQYGIDVDDEGADFAHTHSTGNDPRTLVYTSHGIYPWATTHPLEKRINYVLKQSIAGARRVISVSDEAKAVIEEKWQKPVSLIRNGVFLDQLDQIPEGEFRSRFGINGPYFLWSKNSTEGVSDPTPALELARLLPQYTFVFTLVNIPQPPPNVRVVGVLPHPTMLRAVKDCAVYLGTTKEQFSVGTLEAMGMGKPVLCLSEGGNAKVVTHKLDGYIATGLPDLQRGAMYCLEHRETLGADARETIERDYTWEHLVPKIVAVYWEAIEEWIDSLKQPLVSVVIPHYNLTQFLPETLDSVLSQTITNKEVIVIDDGSTQGDILSIEERYAPLGVRFVRQRNSGVSAARNRGITEARGTYISCLDADDRIVPTFLEELTNQLEQDRRKGIAYTDFELFGDQRGVVKSIDYDFERLTQGNFIPCANVFRREAWRVTGGYKNINPSWEDYELWLNMGKMGFVGAHVPKPLFLYRKRNQQGRDFSSHGHETRLRATVNSYHPDLYTPKLSVVIPTYQHSHVLAETLNSIKQQTYHDYEVIVVDDGNEDRDSVSSVVQNFTESFPIRIIRHEENKGLAAARNTGVVNARGVYILTLDSDDLIRPTFMERTIEVLDARPDIAIVYTDVETFSPAGNQILEMPDYDFDLLLQKNLMACASPFRREVWEKVGGYKTDMIYGWEDYLFWIEAGRKGMCGLHIPEPLFMYRQTGGSMIRQAQKHVADMRRQLREHVPDVFRGERPTMCCGRTRMSQGVGMSRSRGFVAPQPSVGEYALIHMHYKGDRSIRLRTAVTQTFWSLTGGQNLYVDPRDVPQLLSRGDFEYALDEELEEALT